MLHPKCALCSLVLLSCIWSVAVGSPGCACPWPWLCCVSGPCVTSCTAQPGLWWQGQLLVSPAVPGALSVPSLCLGHAAFAPWARGCACTVGAAVVRCHCLAGMGKQEWDCVWEGRISGVSVGVL